MCPEHMLTKEGLRYRFKKQMSDILTLEELTEWYELMQATMLPSDKLIPLDDRPNEVIEKIARGEVTF
jgi:hypothetical protein